VINTCVQQYGPKANTLSRGFIAQIWWEIKHVGLMKIKHLLSRLQHSGMLCRTAC